MREEKTSRTVQRTRTALVRAMVDSIEKVGFQKTTVNDLCERALVSRATFYAHFEDKYHLLRYATESLRADMAATLTECEPPRMLLAMLDHIESHPRFYKNLFLEDGNTELQRMFSEGTVEGLTRQLEHKMAEGQIVGISANMLALFISGGMAHLLIWWISSDMQMPKEELIENLTAIFKLAGADGC